MPQPASRRDGVTAEINVLPLIDVLLVLIVAFFLVQRLRMVADIQLPPPVSSASAEPRSQQLVLEIRADGSFTLNGQPVPDRDLDSRLAAIYRDRPDKLLFVKSAPGRPYSEVIGAIDRAKGAGVLIVGMVPRRERR